MNDSLTIRLLDEALEQKNIRIQELLEANNRYLERARVAEADVEDLQWQLNWYRKLAAQNRSII